MVKYLDKLLRFKDGGVIKVLKLMLVVMSMKIIL
jgi:hypothetical protein